MSETKTKEPKANGEVTAEDARKALEAQARQNAEACSKAIREACEKFNCEIHAEPVLREGRILAQWGIVPRM